MREYRNRICSAVLAAVCVIGTALSGKHYKTVDSACGVGKCGSG